MRCWLLCDLRSLITIFDFHVASRGKIHVSKIRGDRQTFGGRNTTCHGACYTWKDDIIHCRRRRHRHRAPFNINNRYSTPSNIRPYPYPTSDLTTATNLGGAACSYLVCPEPHRYFNEPWLPISFSSYRQPAVSMRVSSILVAVAAATVANISSAQDYQDYADGYEQDNLYQDYAARQQGKEVGGG